MEQNASAALGTVIKAARIARKLSQEKLAELVGLSTRYMTAIENGEKKPAFDKLVKIIRVLGVKTDDIFYPENAAEMNSVQKLSRLLLECNEHEIKAITALVETLLYDKQ